MSDTGDQSTQILGADAALESGGAPPGDHPLEIAARSGFGPLSPAAIEVWHGGGQPCVTCGQLVRRESHLCDHCGQDLSPEMIQRMRAHAGPWYVLEHVRPFPGVSLDRVIRQVHRGLITETSIVRGPTTDYQWRFAVETPGLCRLFRRCWNCHTEVKLAEIACRGCGASLSFDKSVASAAPASANVAGPPPTAVNARPATPTAAGPLVGADQGQLAMLRAAAQTAHRRDAVASADVMKIGGVRVAWLAAVIVVGVFSALVWITQARTRQPGAPKDSVSPPSATVSSGDSTEPETTPE